MSYDIQGDLDGDLDGDSMVGDDLLGDAIVGLLDMSGDTDDDMDGDDSSGDDLMGFSLNPFKRRKQASRRKAAAINKLLLARKMQRGTMVRSLKPVAERNLFLGFTQTAIAASALATITVQPQLPFRGYRLSIPGQITPFFILADVKVGKDSQFVAPGAVPAQSFVETSVGDNISMDTADVGQLITIQVQNIDAGAAHDFRATLFGKTILMGRC